MIDLNILYYNSCPPPPSSSSAVLVYEDSLKIEQIRIKQLIDNKTRTPARAHTSSMRMSRFNLTVEQRYRRVQKSRAETAQHSVSISPLQPFRVVGVDAPSV